MTIYLLDTNHISPALRKTSTLRNRIEQARLLGHRFVTCHPVLCELHAGIQQTRNPAKTLAELNQLLKRVRIWPLDTSACEHYGMIFNELVRTGRVLSQVDIMLASLARLHSLTLLTTDLDFTALPDLRTENWLK